MSNLKYITHYTPHKYNEHSQIHYRLYLYHYYFRSELECHSNGLIIRND